MHFADGELAQLARAPALHAGGQEFESLILHHLEINEFFNSFFLYLSFLKYNKLILVIVCY